MLPIGLHVSQDYSQRFCGATDNFRLPSGNPEVLADEASE